MLKVPASGERGDEAHTITEQDFLIGCEGGKTQGILMSVLNK